MSTLKREAADFRPKTVLDFGTGVGTALWAAQDTFGQMDEVFAVEPSAPMNDVAKAVARKREMTTLDSGSSFRIRLPADAEVLNAECSFISCEKRSEHPSNSRS